MAALHRIVPFDASFLALLHPDRRDHLALIRQGYDDRTVAYLDSPPFMDDIELLGLVRSQPPVRVCDFPVPPREVPTWAEYLEPAGFHEGIGTGLFTVDGRYLGLLGVHTERRRPPSEAVRNLLAVLAPLIAYAVDPMRSLAAVARVVHDALAGVVLTSGGSALPLPGLPGHAALARGSAVLDAASLSVGDDGVHATFLCPHPTVEGIPTYLRVTVMTPPRDVREYAVAVVVLSPSGDLHALTTRELEILGELVEGTSNQRIAAHLAIAESTVATHIEHILVKLAAPSRTVAAVSALRRGLFVPRALHGGASSGHRAGG
jgi:DNA-binding CsgD family transcriptional regulator